MATISDYQINQVNARSALIYQSSSDDPPFLLINMDVNNTIYIDDNPGVNPNSSATDNIPPLGWMVFGPGSEIYGVTLTGQTANVQVVPNASGFNTSPSLIATEIINSGIPLLANPVQLYNDSAVSLGTTGSVVMTPLTPVTVNGVNAAFCGYLSYELSIQITMAVATETTPQVEVQVDWYENKADTIPVDTIIWIVNSSTAGHITFGRGPMRGQYMVVTMTNLTSAANNATVNTFRLAGTSRSVNRDDWREQNAGNLTTGSFKQCTGDGRFNEVGYINNLTVNNGTNLTRQLNLYAGQVQGFIRVTGLTTNQMLVQVESLDPSGFTFEDQFLGSSPTVIENTYAFPRCPCFISFTNNSTVAGTVVAAFGAVER